MTAPIDWTKLVAVNLDTGDISIDGNPEILVTESGCGYRLARDLTAMEKEGISR